jgi:hypothetical protein
MSKLSDMKRFETNRLILEFLTLLEDEHVTLWGEFMLNSLEISYLVDKFIEKECGDLQ